MANSQASGIEQINDTTLAMADYRVLAVTVPDDEIATLAADYAGAPIGRGHTIGSSVRGLVAVDCLAMEISDAMTLCDGWISWPLNFRASPKLTCVFLNSSLAPPSASTAATNAS